MRHHAVLIVDSDPDSLDIYTRMFEHHGLRVIRAASYDECFTEACESLPDVLVLEIAPVAAGEMPVLSRLRGDPRTAYLPIIATSTVMLPPGHKVREACDCYLLKPCIPTRMLQEVRRFIQPLPTLS